MRLSFHSGTQQLIDSVIVIVGTARSGKTLVGNLLGSCERVEHLDEPWLPMMLPVLAGEGVLPEPLAIQMFQASVTELWYDRVLMRHVSFRPTDLSSVWRQKTPQEIFSRLIAMTSREEVRRYTHERHPTLVLTLTDTLPFCQFVTQAFPGCRIVHVVRDGLEVAQAVTEKHWYADEQLLRPQHANPYRAYAPAGRETVYLPYWVEQGQEERFLGDSEFARAVYYWRRLMQMAPRRLDQAGSLHTVRLTDLLDAPRETVHPLLASLGVTPTELTEHRLAGISRSPTRIPDDVLRQVSDEEARSLLECYRQFALPTQTLDRLLVSSLAGGRA